MIIRRAYKRACWEIDTVENICDSLCCRFTAVFFFCRPSRQSRLQECLRERAELLQVQEATSRLREKEKVEYKRAREAWERRCRELERDISRLQHELRQSQEKMEEMERKQKVVYKGGKIKFSFL